jgi:hypothetical protein
MRMPDLIGLLQISGDDRVHEVIDHALFWLVAKNKIQTNRHENHKRNGADDPAHEFRFGFFVIGVEQSHGTLLLPGPCGWLPCSIALRERAPEALDLPLKQRVAEH